MTDRNVYGHFVLNNGIDTYLDLDTNRQFTYIQLNPVRQQLKKEDYVETKGVWNFNDNRYITLNSLTENKVSKKVMIQKVNVATISSFTFYNLLGDTLGIINYTKNGQWFGRVHNLLKSFEVNLSQGDTITADIIGYDKFRFTYSNTSQFVYHVVLYPDYVTDYFKNKKLLFKRNKVIDTELKKTYKRKTACNKSIAASRADTAQHQQL